MSINIDKCTQFHILKHMTQEKSQANKLLTLAAKQGIVKVGDLEREGIHPELVRRLQSRGALKKVGRGMYALAEAQPTENHDLALAAKWVPSGVICLLTALRYHEIGTQAPYQVWMALKRGSAKPRIEVPPLKIVWFSGLALSKGLEAHEIEGVPVKVYSAAKTIADCFKYRNKIGLDVAIEALKEVRVKGRCSNTEIWEYAKICRVTKIIRPYLEAIN